MRITLILCSLLKASCVFIPKYTLTNSKQIKYQNMINDKNLQIIIVNGPAGTGKTMIACQEAIKMFKNNEKSKIIITRPVVTVEENIGFLPGNLEDKLYPYMIPVYDYFLEYYTKETLTSLITSNKIEIAPLAFMRGRTFKDAIIIADEMQNTTPNQMKTILTRIGENSKLIIMGDLEQKDLNVYNGLQNLIDLINNKYPNYYPMDKDGFGYIYLDKSCIKRSPIIEKILNLYE